MSGVESLQKALDNRPTTRGVAIPATVVPYCEEYERFLEDFTKKFTAFQKTHVIIDRKQLSDLLKDAPSYEELDDIGGMQNVSVQMWGSRVEEWISKVKEFVESSGEPLNLALAFTDVKKKKKGSGSEKK